MTTTDAQQRIAAALHDFPGPACVTSSFQAECVALVHMLVQQQPEIPVLFLDTGYHFPETYEYRDRIARSWNLNLVNLLPQNTVAQQESEFGILYQSAPDRCCGMRKVEPLFASLENYALWFTALRRDQSPTRAKLPVFGDFALPTGRHLIKVSPLADWTTKDVWDYARQHEIPLLPLYEQGYTSIGCQPCTALPDDAHNPRSGRWSGKKLECGIHISEPGQSHA